MYVLNRRSLYYITDNLRSDNAWRYHCLVASRGPVAKEVHIGARTGFDSSHAWYVLPDT